MQCRYTCMHEATYRHPCKHVYTKRTYMTLYGVIMKQLTTPKLYTSLRTEYLESIYSGGLYPFVPGSPAWEVIKVLPAHDLGNWIENPKSDNNPLKLASIRMLELHVHAYIIHL